MRQVEAGMAGRGDRRVDALRQQLRLHIDGIDTVDRERDDSASCRSLVMHRDTVECCERVAQVRSEFAETI